MLAQPRSQNVRLSLDSPQMLARLTSRSSLFVASSGSPLPADGSPPKLSLHALLTTARLGSGDPSLDIDDIESMCASLVDQVSQLAVQSREHAS